MIATSPGFRPGVLCRVFSLSMITIIDYGAGNPTSVRLALDALGIPNRLTSDPGEIRCAERILFPGVGAARSAMETLRVLHLDAAMTEAVSRGVPFLGICLGMQVLLERSEEDGGTDTLGLLPGTVRRFVPRDRVEGIPRDKVPQIGWNEVRFEQPHPVFAGIPENSYFYFVHAYYAVPAGTTRLFGSTDYAGIRFASAVGRDNLLAVQFHPEKSGPVGLTLLAGFARWDGRLDDGGDAC